MMSQKRTTSSIMNASFASISQSIILIFSFVTRTFFIKILGTEYLGFDALFSNILSVLSIVDLGIGTALNFSLYRPMHDGNEGQIAAIVQYFRKIFFSLGLILLAISFIITPFINYFVKDIGNNLVYMQKVFFLYSIMTFSSYFFIDSRTLYFSAQQNYKIAFYDMISKILIKICQIILLCTYPSYLIYLFIELFFNFVTNILLRKKAEQDFQYVYNNRIHLDATTKKIIFNDVKYLSLGKVASVGIGSTDSLIISKFVGAASLGIYSNYWLITGAISNLITVFTNGITASLGNLFAENNQEKIKKTFKLYNFITFQASAFYLISVLSLIQPFMYLWLNGDLLLDRYIIGIVVFNNAFLIMWNSLRNIIQTKGLFKKDLPIQLTQVTINLVVSVILVQKFGMIGVFVGTSISQIIAYLLQANLISDEVLKSNLISLLGQQIFYGVISFFQLFFIYAFVDLVFINYTLSNLILRGISVVLFFAISEYLIYRKNIEFKTCLLILMKYLNKGNVTIRRF